MLVKIPGYVVVEIRIISENETHPSCRGSPVRRYVTPNLVKHSGVFRGPLGMASITATMPNIVHVYIASTIISRQ